ncbi:MAG: NAD-dependent epimerase/dehydratase family protein [bacterium]
MKEADLVSKKILITGASGFVGAVLLRRVVTKYPKAIPYVLLRKTSKTWRIDDILGKTNVLEGDVTDFETIHKLVQKIKPDVVFHLAAYGAYHYQDSLDEAIKVNYLGTKNLLTALEKIHYRLFVNTGSSSEYGYKNHAMKETDFLEPASFYAATKAAVTHLCTTYSMLNNRPIVTLRPFSVYGPYEEPGRFMPTAILGAIGEKVINVVKGPVRDFIYVEDFVDAYFDCLRLKSFNHRIFNICSGTQVSIEKTARMVIKLVKSKSQLTIGTYKSRPWDTNHWVGSNFLAKDILGWKPKHSLEDGLIKSIKWFNINKEFYEK